MQNHVLNLAANATVFLHLPVNIIAKERAKRIVIPLGIEEMHYFAV